MNKLSKILLLSIGIALIVSAYLYANISKKTVVNLATKTSYNLTSGDLIANFITDEKKSNQKFEGKILEITGKVKEISFLNNTNTIILVGNNKAGIICDFSKNQTKAIQALTKNETVTIKGTCKGFLKDVILLNCILLNTKTNE